MPSPALRQSVYTTAWREPYILHSYMHMYVRICVYGGAGFKVIMKINETQNNPKRSLGDAFICQAVSIRTRAEFGFLAQDGLWPTAAHGSFDGWFRRSSAGGPAADSPSPLFVCSPERLLTHSFTSRCPSWVPLLPYGPRSRTAVIHANAQVARSRPFSEHFLPFR